MAKDGLLGSVAEDVVFSNFGEDMGGTNSDLDLGGAGDNDLGDDDLGDEGDDDFSARGGQDDDFSLDEGDSDGDDDNIFNLREDRRSNRDELDDMRRVSHTDDRRRPIPKKAEVKPDRNGNLVDKNGKVVARAGAQARFYQNMQKAKAKEADAVTQLQDANQRLNRAVEIGRSMHAELTQFKAAAAKMKEFGLEPNDQLAAFQLYSDISKDPAGTLRKLLTRAATQGITVGNVGGNQNGQTDVKSLVDVMRAEIAKSLNPLKERSDAEKAERERQQREQAGLNEVRQEVNGFFNRNPEARRYISVFQRVMKDPRYSNLSLPEIYLRIKESNPENRQNQPSSRRRTPPAGRSLPRGRSTPPGNDRRGPDRNQMASLDDSYDTIISGVLEDHGMRRAV